MSAVELALVPVLVTAAGVGGFAAARMRQTSPAGRHPGFAVGHPRIYEAMFSLPSGLAFGVEDTPEPMQRAFWGIRDAFPAADDTRAEVAWATLHGLATLGAGGRLRPDQTQARLELAHRILTEQESR